ncbi:MAG: hypothetical protein ABSA05_16100 [Opitutaceae bacterium]|jgi:hypothetical protein
MAEEMAVSGDEEPVTHVRWVRTPGSTDFFMDEDRLRRVFWFLVAGGVVIFVVLGLGLWRLGHAALAPPAVVGISHGLIFSGSPQGLGSVRESDFDQELSDTIEVLFSRTEKGLPPAIREFCAPEVVTQVDQAYRDGALKFPAGYVQTMTVLESRVAESRMGRRRMLYRGLLSSRSVSSAQTSPIYLDGTFIISSPTPLNAVGWRLVHVDAISRDDFYRTERDAEIRKALNLPSASPP